MKHKPRYQASAGFSLLEVLVAVVLLATGLLALAALQGALARSSADAKTRSRVVSLLSAEMDAQRSTAYAAITSLGTPTTAVNPDCTDLTVLNAVEVAACEAGLSNLTLNRTVSVYGANSGATAFAAGAPAGSNKAEFKRVTVTASWTDAGGQSRSVDMSTVISSLALEVNNPIVDNDSGNAPPPGPTVRQPSPLTAGMIPIALGNGDSTAASNPTPELVGKNNNQVLVGTRFNVLTYTPEDNNLAIIQQRIETEVIKCTCQYGAGGNNLGEIYRASQWPAVWTGRRYDVYVPDSPMSPPGQQYASGPKAGVTQSPLCQECCRDHHDDPTDTANAKFDPEKSSNSYQKYNLNGSGQLVAVANTTSGTYVDACRVIRVGGLWRTAADMYSRQFGLLETQSVGGVQAKTGLPTTTATTNYTNFVKDYLKQYDGSVGTAPPGAQTLFDNVAYGLNVPAVVNITSPSNSDYRYLHGRGLYVDHLEKQARDALADALASRRAHQQCEAGGSDLPDCVLPFLPFTTVNLTEIAKWTATDATVLSVNSGNLLALNPSQPSGSRSYGVKIGTATNTATLLSSNSGVAVSTDIPGAVDQLGDETELSDAQPFAVGGSTGGGDKDEFTVAISGGGSNPYVFYTLGTDTAECVKPASGNHRCTTNSTLPLSGSLRLAHYWVEASEQRTVSVLADGASGPGIKCINVEKNKTFNGQAFTVDAPVFRNYRVSGASVTGGGTITSALPAPADSGTDNTASETTTITYASLAKDARINVGFELEGTRTDSSISSCTLSKSGSNWTITVTAWTRPWL